MKYLLIFLPIFCFAQSGDSTLYGTRTDIDSFQNTSYPDTCWEIKNGWMSLKPGCVLIPYFNTSGSIVYTGFKEKTQEFYVSDRIPKVIESFKYLGAYYELRENGWYKEILPDTIPDYIRLPEGRESTMEHSSGALKIKGDSVFRWAEEPNSCDQHIGTRDMPKRDKMDRTKAKIIVWNGCAMIELEVYKITHYNEMTVAKNTGGLAIYMTETIKVDVVTEYLYDGGWIKNSRVIKEL